MNLQETSIRDFKEQPICFVIQDIEKKTYLGIDDEGQYKFYKSLEDAEVISPKDNFNDVYYDFIDSYDLTTLKDRKGIDLNQYIQEEKDFWGDEYDKQPKDSLGIIDDWDLREEVKSFIKIIPIYCSKLEESKEIESSFKEAIEAGSYSIQKIDIIYGELAKVLKDIKDLKDHFSADKGPIKYIAGRKAFNSADEAAAYQKELLTRKIK